MSVQLTDWQVSKETGMFGHASSLAKHCRGLRETSFRPAHLKKINTEKSFFHGFNKDYATEIVSLHRFSSNAIHIYNNDYDRQNQRASARSGSHDSF